MICEKEMRLIAMLVKTNDYLTAQQLANQLDVSTRTVMRAVKKINDNSDEQQLIESEKGRGYKINYDEYLKSDGEYNKISVYSPTERRNEVLLNLLFRSPSEIPIRKLFEKFYVSETVVNSDLAVIKKQIESDNIQLVNRNRAVKVIGKEREIRQLIIGVINKLELTDYDMIRKEFPELTDYDLRFITTQIDYIEDALDSTIPSPYNINLFSHIYILMKRYRQGVTANFQLENLIGDREQDSIDKHQRLYKIADKVVRQISDYLGMNIPQIEKYYILQYLISSRLISEPGKDSVYSLDVAAVVKDLISGMATKLNAEIDDKEITTDLALHVQPMINRLVNEIEINNPLLSDIESEYPQVFNATKEVVNDVIGKRYSQSVSDDEVGFITLYFAKYLEQHERQLRILIMCSSGVGTSELLKVKVKKQFPELLIDDVVSLKVYEKKLDYFENRIDLIITTIRVDDKMTKHPVLLVNAMFNHADQDRVQKTIEELNGYGR